MNYPTYRSGSAVQAREGHFIPPPGSAYPSQYAPQYAPHYAPMTPFEGYDPDAMAMTAGDGDEKKFDLYKKLHRLLRGRYAWLFLLACILGAAGGYLGWVAKKPIYRAEGVIQIQNQLPSITGSGGGKGGEPIPDYEQFILTQTGLIATRPVVNKALADPAWISSKRDATRSAIKDFVENMAVEHPPHTETIRVYFTDVDPNVSALAVRAIVNTYQHEYEARELMIDRTTLRALEDRRDELKKRLEAVGNRIDFIAREYGTIELGPIIQMKTSAMAIYEQKLTDAEVALQLARRSMPPDEMIHQLTNYQIGMLDPTMHQKIEQMEQLEMQLQTNATLGEKHPRVLQLKSLAESARKNVEQYALEYKELNLKMATNPTVNQKAGGLTSLLTSVETIRDQRSQFEGLVLKAKQDLATVGGKQLDLRAAMDEQEKLSKELEEKERRIAVVMTEGQIGGRLRIITPGEPPVFPYKDRRLAFAALGGTGGLFLAFLLMVFVGLSDRRYRFSDDADIVVAGRPPLLGILPTLPDRLTDPEQAAVAAHCIHQIRIMLQLAGGPGHSRAFMTTSASTGDGKTSLTMALGLSFAASGSRTLVIDADMVGQGLTHRLRAAGSAGMLEALNTGSLQGKVKKTSTANLFILPVGVAESSSAGSLSPQSVAHLLGEARKIFDVILIDTGPILGSLEASVVAGAADGVVLTVSRGQNQDLVDRALRQLRAIGAKMSGMVFNRAERRDFHRSVASASMRSSSAAPHAPRPLLGEGEEGSRFGPLARCVASCMPATPGPNVKELGNGNGSGHGGNGHGGKPSDKASNGPAVAGVVVGAPSAKNVDKNVDKTGEKNGERSAEVT